MWGRGRGRTCSPCHPPSSLHPKARTTSKGGEGCSNHKKRNLIYNLSYNKRVWNCEQAGRAWQTISGGQLVMGVAGNNSIEGGTDHPVVADGKTGFD